MPTPETNAQKFRLPGLLRFALLLMLGLITAYVAANTGPLGGELSLHITCWIMLFTISVFCTIAFTGRNNSKISIFSILITGLLFRVIFLALPESDDLYRYIWEGRLVEYNLSPYTIAPASPPYNLPHEMQTKEVFASQKLINHPEMTSCYPPLFLKISAFIQDISYSPLAYKIFALLCDMSALLVLLLILRDKLLPVRLALLYAINPLLLFAYAGNGHYDPLMILLLLLSIYNFNQKKYTNAYIALALAVAAKYTAIICLPFIISRKNYKKLPVFLVVLIFSFIPELITEPTAMLSSLYTFGTKMAFNGPLHSILRSITSDSTTASYITGTILLVVFFSTLPFLHPESKLNKINDPAAGFLFMLGMLLLLSPNVHFWYWGWLIPLAIIRRNWLWFIPCLTLCFCLPVFHNQIVNGVWFLPLWAQLAEWLPFFIPALISLPFILRRIKAPKPTRLNRFTVIVPVKNYEPGLDRCLQSIRSSSAVKDILIAASENSAPLRHLAIKHDAQFVINSAPPHKGGGRGGQICAALKETSNNWIAIVHADVCCQDNAFDQLADFIRRNPEICGGALGGQFSENGSQAIQTLNDLRAEFTGISFGDQIQFYNRRTINKCGGFPDYPLMEDIELSLRLWQCGKTAFLWQANLISSRHWQDRRFIRAIKIISICNEYFLRRIFGRVDTIKMYNSYYAIPARAMPEKCPVAGVDEKN